MSTVVECAAYETVHVRQSHTPQPPAMHTFPDQDSDRVHEEL